MIQSVAFIAVGVLINWLAGWIARFYAGRADKWERDGVIRYGGFGPKVWSEDDPQIFATRINDERFDAAAMRWFLRIIGSVFAIGGAAKLIGSLLK